MGVGDASGVLVRAILLAEIISTAVTVAAIGFRNSSPKRNSGDWEHTFPVHGQALAPKQQGPQ